MSGNGCVVDGWKKNGKPLKKRPKILLLGIFLTLIGLISLLFYWGKISKSIPTVFFECGHVPAYDQLGRILFCSVE